MAARLLSNPLRRQAGVALIIALILLMVLTMVAVIAMRTTTLDLKMAANQVMSKRTFQVSETARSRVHGVLDAHAFYRGWPVAIGGSVPASSGFAIPAEIQITAPLQELYLQNNADQWDTRPAAEDMRLQEGTSPYTGPYDLLSPVYISRVTAIAAPGSDTSQVTGYEGLGAGAAGAGSHLYFRIIANAAGSGASQAMTEAMYRYVITN